MTHSAFTPITVPCEVCGAPATGSEKDGIFCTDPECVAHTDAAQLVAEMSRDDLRDYATERWEEGIQQLPMRWECYTLGGLMRAIDEAVETRCRVEMSGVDYGY